MAELRDAPKSSGDYGSNLRVTKFISLEVEVSFSTQSMNEESDRRSADDCRNQRNPRT